MTINILVGNLILLIACVIMVISGIPKDKKRAVILQTTQLFLSSISLFILGSIPGVINNLSSCVRNLLSYYNKLNNVAKALLIIVTLASSLLFNNIGIFGILPIFASIIFIVLMNTQDMITFSLITIVTMITSLIHDIYIKAYISVPFNIANIVANIIRIIRIKKDFQK